MIKYLKNTKYIFFFREAFKSLSDAQKLKFVSLVLKDENLKDGFVKSKPFVLKQRVISVFISGRKKLKSRNLKELMNIRMF